MSNYNYITVIKASDLGKSLSTDGIHLSRRGKLILVNRLLEVFNANVLNCIEIKTVPEECCKKQGEANFLE